MILMNIILIESHVNQNSYIHIYIYMYIYIYIYIYIYTYIMYNIYNILEIAVENWSEWAF